MTEIEDLPDEVLEFILSLLPPYQDLHDCMLVSKRWRRCVLNVAKTKLRNLRRAIVEFDIKWNTLTPTDLTPTISKRYSHTAAIHSNSMYVFGGCTCSMTTFNDLWRLDLSRRQWIRPLAMGTYPSPKACSTLVCYNDLLILFGGWTYPPSYPLYQSWHLFNELHVYDIEANRWSSINCSDPSPPPMAGHSATIVGDWMIVFGGLQKPSTAVHCEKSNDVWKLNLKTWTWSKQETEGELKPTGRLGQTQILLDNENILILGGSAGPSLNYYDAWILNMTGDKWKWTQIDVLGKTNRPGNIWTNPGCKVGDKLVVLNRIREQPQSSVVYYPKNCWLGRRRPDDGKSARIDLANRPQDIDENVNGKRGILRNKREAEDEHPHENNPFVNNISTTMNLAAFHVNSPETTKSERMRLQRLAHLSDVKDRINRRSREMNSSKEKLGGTFNNHFLGIYVLDLSKALDYSAPSLTWLPPKNLENGPEETILYTLLEGKSELVMFGGIKKDPTSLGSVNINNQISNALHFISAPKYII